MSTIRINLIGLEVTDIVEVLPFYDDLFYFSSGRRSENHSIINLDDQFIYLFTFQQQPADDARRFGFIVDDFHAKRSIFEQNASIRPNQGTTISLIRG